MWRRGSVKVAPARQDAIDGPALTIVTVCFCNPEELRDTLLSCDVDHLLVEIIIIDGSDDDRCEKVVVDFPQHGIRYLRERDDGLYDAMNKGVSLALGKTILMLNSGDLMYDGPGLTKCVKNLGEKLSTHIIYGNCIDRFDGVMVPRKPIAVVDAEKIRRGDLPSHQAVMVPSWYCQANPYSREFRIAADTLFLREAFVVLPQLHIDLAFSVFGFGGRSNCAPKIRDVFSDYRETVAVRDLHLRERVEILLRLLARSMIGKVLGPTAHRRLQARRAKARLVQRV